MAGAAAVKRIQLNRAVLDECTLAMSDGLFELSGRVIAAAHVPDRDPIGLGLVQGGGSIGFVKGKRVNATTIGGKSIKVPRAAHVSRLGVVVIGGWGFPARFVELGTVRMRAEPFATPALMSEVPDAADYIRSAAEKRGLTSAARRAAGDVYGGSKS